MPQDRSDQFRIEEAHDGGTVVLDAPRRARPRVGGRRAAALDELCAAGAPTRLDLDDARLHGLVRAARRAAGRGDGRDGGWRFTLTPGSEQVRQLFASAGVADRLPIVTEP